MSMQPTLHEWSAKRSGAYLTIDGFDAQGKPAKLVQVTSIQIDPEGPFAIFTNGKTYRLEQSLPDV